MWAFPWSEDDSPKPVLILIDLERPTEPGEAALRHLFGLTGAEAKLAASLSSGRSLEEVACERRITIGTARSQLRSIFAKTQTHRQAELVALLNRAGLLRVDGHPLALSDLGG
jgi:DNA-binding CsgD family transcriptional regulator